MVASVLLGFSGVRVVASVLLGFWHVTLGPSIRLRPLSLLGFLMFGVIGIEEVALWEVVPAVRGCVRSSYVVHVRFCAVCMACGRVLGRLHDCIGFCAAHA